MSEALIEKMIFIESELKKSEDSLNSAKEKIIEQSQLITMLKLKLQHKETHVQIAATEFNNFEEIIKAQGLQIQQLVQTNQTLMQELEAAKTSGANTDDFNKIHRTTSDLDLIRMQYSDLEANYFRNQVKMMEQENNFNNKLKELFVHQSKEVQDKRNKWLDSKTFAYEAQKDFRTERRFT